MLLTLKWHKVLFSDYSFTDLNETKTKQQKKNQAVHKIFGDITQNPVILPLMPSSLSCSMHNYSLKTVRSLLQTPRLQSSHFFITHCWSWGLTDEVSALNEMRTISMRTMNIQMSKTSNYCTCVLSTYLAILHHIYISFKLTINLKFPGQLCHFFRLTSVTSPK